VSTSEKAGPAFFILDQVDWVDEDKAGVAPRELVEEAKKKGARRKFLARGEGSFHSQFSEFPPGYVVPMHSHDHDEMLVILDGSCTMLGEGGPTLKAKDSVVLLGGFEYGFESGAQGMKFLTIRTAASGTKLTK
jgi:quercetin dioxygenase-like cupin family protein